MSRVIWGSINVGTMPQWYPLCVKYLLRCNEMPQIAVVLEADPVPDDIKLNIQKMTWGITDWLFVPHGMKTIANINNDNARNLRHLVPLLGRLARPDDLIALIEQDVILLKRNWIDDCRKLLVDSTLVSSAGSFTGANLHRRLNPKPYFSIFKAGDANQLAASIKTNRGSFVTLNIDNSHKLDKHKILVGKSHAFGTQDQVWAIHARGGSNHNGKAQRSIDYFSKIRTRKYFKSIRAKW